ncbi:hypothetical protein Poli38472_014626 [Pythium oligandrum]|uniref:Protein kinase domain-containing protein n=1 Tax=Pythium oligandrum TaxID=41045 RepID=A0A8K1CHZ8_PYTOL|nr:hypothetical protein Poli38472_014626 [Pythium oligandrum]|eukprot:TMW63921.1 hypothetical protein Poli38472_014626 [Pythium oligandrum]
MRVLRRAIYGHVALVRHQSSNNVFAMKVMSLAHMRLRRAVSGVRVREDGMTELQILRRISGNHVFCDADTHGYQRTWSRHPDWRPASPSKTASVDKDIKQEHTHHHILTLHADFVDERTNARCLVLDYCPYGELYDQLQRAPTQSLGVETARVFFKQIVTALRFIHGMNIAHRDVSLENVLVDSQKECRLGDFGLASEDGTVCSGRVGKIFYMAPEVHDWQPLGVYNGMQADVWSLGVLLFILVTGVPPFEAPHDGDARFRMVKYSGVQALLVKWQLDSRLPVALQDLLDQLLRVNTDERPDINEVYAHSWLVDDAVDQQALMDEGNFSKNMVEWQDMMTARDVEARTPINKAQGTSQRRPQGEIDIEVLCPVEAAADKRYRKRIKRSADIHGKILDTSGVSQVGWSTKASETSVPRALWSLPGSDRALVNESKRDDEEKDSKPDDNDGWDSDSTASLGVRPFVGKEDSLACLHCRFCLQWLDSDQSALNVTPEHLEVDASVQPNRVCDKCLHTPTSASTTERRRHRTRNSSGSGSGSGRGVHRRLQVA